MKYNLNFFSFIFISLFTINSIKSARHTKEEWKSRTIYQLLTDRFALPKDDDIAKCSMFNESCGGNYQGIINHLDYIKGMGFGAIWISPPLKNKEGSYHGYHNIDINSLNENFGNETLLRRLITECHNRDIWVILDFVPNHMAGGLDFSNFIPFNKKEHYHSLTDADCEGHWDEQPYKENCSIWGLPDLNHENPYVNSTLINWLKDNVTKYDFDGVRYADVPNAPTWFWNNLTHVLDGMYTIGVFDSKDVDYVASYQNYMDGVADFPLLYQLRNSFCNGSMLDLDDYIQNIHSKYKNPQYNGIWFDNHDKERFLYECPTGIKPKGLKNVIIFTLFFKGIPIFYYGDEQYLAEGGVPDKRRQPLFGNYDEESDIYQAIKIAHQVRKEYKIYDIDDLVVKYVDENNTVFTRGNDVMIAVNKGLVQTINVPNNGLINKDKFCNRLKVGDCIREDEDYIRIEMDGQPKIFTRKSRGEIVYISNYLLLFLILLVLF